MDPTQREKDRRSAWQAAQGRLGELWPLLLDDVNRFAMEAQDPAVRCGRHDVVAYIVDSVIGAQEE